MRVIRTPVPTAEQGFTLLEIIGQSSPRHRRAEHRLHQPAAFNAASKTLGRRDRAQSLPPRQLPLPEHN
jgi:hypothetical protein